jgi:hypothetical protein
VLEPSEHYTPALAEPPTAGAFMAAYARGDEGAAERLASPLYGDEWARLGLSVADRRDLLPRWFRDAPPDPNRAWQRFAYVDGAPAPGGFGHLLYAALPVRPEVAVRDREASSPGDRPLPAAWRVDLAPDGRVIWIEMVWLFAGDARRLRPIDVLEEEAPVPLPEPLQARRPRLLFGLRSGVGQEGYYAFALSPAREVGPVLFLARDPEGGLRPGAWSFGRRPGGLEAHLPTYGASAPAPRPAAPEHPALRRAYLDALCC